MDWYGSYTRRFRAFYVDPESWEDLAEIGGVESLDIAWDAASDSIQDGSMQVIGDQPNGIVRIYLEANGEGEGARVAVATMNATSNERSILGDDYSARVEMESVLQAASETELPAGYFAPRGSDPVRFALDLIARYVQAPVDSARSDKTLPRTVVAEQGDTVITFAKTLMEGTGSRLTVDGRGVVSVADNGIKSALRASQIYADGVTDKTDGGVRTISYTRPFDPSIKEGSTVSLFVPQHGITGDFTVSTQRLSDACEVQEVVTDGSA